MASSSDTTKPARDEGVSGDPGRATVITGQPVTFVLGETAISDDLIRRLRSGGASSNPPDEAEEQAQQSMFRDIDAILARLESGIEAERSAVDALLDRLTTNAA
jgi:hypothetical protein